MDILIRLLSKAYIHGTLILFGALLILFSVVAKIPGTSGGEIVLRDRIPYLPLAIGLALMVSGTVVAIRANRWEMFHNSDLPKATVALGQDRDEFEDLIKLPRSSTTSVSRIATSPPPDEEEKRIEEPPQAGLSRMPTLDLGLDSIQPSSPDYSTRLGDRFLALSQTQKFVVSYLYRMVHATEISVDDLTVGFNKKYADKAVASSAEMYYRLATLSNLGFVRIHPIGNRSSKVLKIPEAGAVLLNGNLLDS